MLGALDIDLSSVERVSPSDIPDMIERHGWRNARARQGTLGPHTDPALVFTTLALGDAPDVSATLKQCPPGTSAWLVGQLLGRGGKGMHHEAANSGRVCRSRYQFDTIYGCPHGCKYCCGGRVSVVFTNLEEFVERQVAPTAAQHLWQKVFMFNSCLSDTLCFEPEYGLSKLLVDHFASTPDQHYLIHTKSANADFLRDLDHRGRTIALWSLTNETTSRVIEPGSATTEQRIDAARQCQDAGYTVRFKFKPIVPVKEWRDECRRMIEMVFSRTRPDNLGVCTIAWMSAEELKSCIDVSLLDPAFVQAMDEAADQLKGVAPGPFPHAVRAEIYEFFLNEIRRHDRDVPVFLCTESPEMWREFAQRLGVASGNYACGCGPQCPPGSTRLSQMQTQAEIS